MRLRRAMHVENGAMGMSYALELWTGLGEQRMMRSTGYIPPRRPYYGRYVAHATMWFSWAHGCDATGVACFGSTSRAPSTDAFAMWYPVRRGITCGMVSRATWYPVRRVYHAGNAAPRLR
jgi:hypothetical protein